MKIYRIIITLLLTGIVAMTFAQGKEFKVKGRVLGENGKPVEGAFVSSTGVRNIKTDGKGEFEITLPTADAPVSVWADGYYRYTRPAKGQQSILVTLIPQDKPNYSQDAVMPAGVVNTESPTGAYSNIAKKDFGNGRLRVEDAMAGKVAGLQVIGKSGMPGEGSYLNLRGIRSLEGANAPLVVINGVPYMPDMNESPLINGYSRGIFSTYNINDLQNITVLKGAATSLYGSMGSNGVIMIETDGANSDDLNTRISFTGQYGVNYKGKNQPLLGVGDYKNYLTDIGMTRYSNMADLFAQFPFLQDDPDYYYKFMYNNNTNWQKEIYTPSFVTDNLLRVEGGDAIAKYDISVGYMGDRGTLDKTKTDRYHTQINTNIMVSRKIELFATVGLAYLESQLQNQGMVAEINPMLAALYKAPVLSPWQRNADNKNLVQYDTARYGVSNPVAIVNSLEARSKVYDINVRAGLNYRPNTFWTISGMFSLFYNYNRENMFIPGMTSQTIVYQNHGKAKNTVKTGVAEALNMFYRMNAGYSRTFGLKHDVNFNLSGQVLTTRREYDAGTGFNTTNDFYQTLNSVTDNTNLKFTGYIDLWNWMNYGLHADYTFNKMLRAEVNIAADAASSTGIDATRFGWFPSVGLSFMAKNTSWLINSQFINRLNLRAEYGLTGNSRFSSNYGKNYYESSMFQELSGIRRVSLPNTKLKWENNEQLNLGIDFSLWNNRIDLSADYYLVNSRDVLFKHPVSSVFGTDSYYDNVGKIRNEGVELALQASLVRTRDFEWIVGGNIAFAKSKVKSLGAGVNERIVSLSDGSQIITRVGASPYEFYGLQANGIFRTSADAAAAGLHNVQGKAYEAGDVRFTDLNNDNIISEKDRVLLGSAQPKYNGAFYTSVRYRNFMLSADFTYSQGNKAYNAVRRELESMSTFNNQSRATAQRWQLEGQATDMPRATYGDPMGNAAFSSRWIEDASYLKLKYITLSYTFNRTFLRLFRSGTIYVTGENLFTFTDYLGADPEFSYSYEDMRQGIDYAKVPLAKSVKFGINLKF